MAMVLNTNEVLEALYDEELPELEQAVERLEKSLKFAAKALAKHTDARLLDVSNQFGFAGLCATFIPKRDDQPCPDVLRSKDPSGDWEEDYPVMRKARETLAKGSRA